MIQKYKKKPIIIEAVQCVEPNTPMALANWCGGKACGVGNISANQWIEIETLEGTMRANYKDWIIKGIGGEFYPCKPHIFKETYDALHENDGVKK